MKIKICLLATVFVFSMYSVTHASNTPQFAVNGEEYLFLYEFVDVTESTSDRSGESDVPFQAELDMGLIAIYPPVEVEKEPEIYTVMQGDNLYRIALNHDIHLADLMSWNNLTGDLIHPGEELIVSSDEEEVQSVEAEISTEEVVFSPDNLPPLSSSLTSTASTPPVSEGKRSSLQRQLIQLTVKAVQGQQPTG